MMGFSGLSSGDFEQQNSGLSKSGTSGLSKAPRNALPLTQTADWVKACEWNDEGYRLVKEGHIQPGLNLLSRSARFGLPWALATYTWQCLLAEDFERGLREFHTCEEACESVVARLQREAELAELARLQWANARSNTALLMLATGAPLETARDIWIAGVDTGHPESMFYPALVADRLGDLEQADSIVQGLPAAIWMDVRQTLHEGIAEGGWFGQWSRDGLMVLERSEPSSP